MDHPGYRLHFNCQEVFVIYAFLQQFVAIDKKTGMRYKYAYQTEFRSDKYIHKGERKWEVRIPQRNGGTKMKKD